MDFLPLIIGTPRLSSFVPGLTGEELGEEPLPLELESTLTRIPVARRWMDVRRRPSNRSLSRPFLSSGSVEDGEGEGADEEGAPVPVREESERDSAVNENRSGESGERD